MGWGVGKGPQNYDNRRFEVKYEMTIIVISVSRSCWIQSRETNQGTNPQTNQGNLQWYLVFT